MGGSTFRRDRMVADAPVHSLRRHGVTARCLAVRAPGRTDLLDGPRDGVVAWATGRSGNARNAKSPVNRGLTDVVLVGGVCHAAPGLADLCGCGVDGRTALSAARPRLDPC